MFFECSLSVNISKLIRLFEMDATQIKIYHIKKSFLLLLTDSPLPDHCKRGNNSINKVLLIQDRFYLA